MRVRVRACVFMYVCAYVCVCVDRVWGGGREVGEVTKVCMCMYVYLYLYVCACACMCFYVGVCMYVCGWGRKKEVGEVTVVLYQINKYLHVGTLRKY